MNLGGKLYQAIGDIGTAIYSYSSQTGKLTAIQAPDADGGTVGYTYDGFLPLSETWSGGAVAGSVSWTYNSDLRVQTETVDTQAPITFGFDDDGLLTGAGGLTINRSSQNGLVTGTVLDQVSTSNTYNGFGELATFSATANGSAVYSATYDDGGANPRDQLGRVVQKTETIGGVTSTYRYEYDQAGRLTDVCKDGYRVTKYIFDSNSNRQTKRTCTPNAFLCQPATPCATGTDVSGTYDNQDRMTAYGSGSYTYTDNGELLSKTVGGQTTSYTFDVFGTLRTVNLPGGNHIDYVIDGRNRRVGKMFNNALVQGFLYDGQLRVVGELDSNGTLVSQFIYGTKVNVPEYMIQNSTNYMIQNSTTYRIITDQLGSVRLVVNASTGAIAQRIDYDEFGVVTSDTNPGFQPFGFAGGLYDSDTGLVRFGARDYDPETGRWTTKDPIGFAGRVTNLYEYVINDPVQFGDPDGLQLILIGDLPPLPPWAVPLLGERPPYPGWMKNLAPSNRYNPTGKFPTPTPPPPVDFCPQLPPNLTTGMKPTSTIWDVIFKIWQVAITIGESIGGPGEAPMIIPVTTEPGPIFVGPGMGAA